MYDLDGSAQHVLDRQSRARKWAARTRLRSMAAPARRSSRLLSVWRLTRSLRGRRASTSARA